MEIVGDSYLSKGEHGSNFFVALRKPLTAQSSLLQFF